jgi:Tfp pilus assembly protein PilO
VKMSSRERIAILIGVAAMAAVLVFYAATQLVPDSQNLSREVDLKKKMLRSQRDTLSREDIYKTRLDQYRKQLDQDMTRFLPGENASLAGAELQKVIKDFADRSGVEINQRIPQPEKKIPGIAVKVAVRIETNCNPEQLVQFLASIESYEKLLKIDELVISSMRIQKRFEIHPSVTISGYIRAPEEKPKEKAPAKAGSSNVS